MQSEDKIIGNCTYSFRKANFMVARTEAFKLTALLKGCFASEGKTDFDIGQLLSNLNSQEMNEVEKFIAQHTVVTDENGKKFILQKDNEAENFFNEHRDQYLQFLFEGLKFHFLGFLPNGLASKVSTLSLDNLADLAM